MISQDHLILGGTVLFLAIFVLLPAFRLWIAKKKISRKEWREVAERIGSLDSANLPLTGYSTTTRGALELVLTNKPGVGRKANIPLAVDLIESEIESVSRSFRAYSSQAVMIGLLGTVAAFAVKFSLGHIDLYNPAESVLDWVGIVYVINSIAILSAVLLYFLHIHTRRRGDATLSLVLGAFSQLRDDVVQDTDPNLVRALEEVSTQFKDVWDELFTRQFGQIASTLSEVKGLAETVRNMIPVAAEAVEEDETDKAILAILRDLSARDEVLFEQLDEGFKILAQPFLQGIPIMERVGTAADELKKSAETIPTAMESLSKAMEEQRSATKKLLEQVSADVDTATSGIPAAVGTAVTDGLREGLPSLAAGISVGMDRMESRLGALQESLERAVEELASMRSAVDEMAALRGDVTKVMERLRERRRREGGWLRRLFSRSPA